MTAGQMKAKKPGEEKGHKAEPAGVLARMNVLKRIEHADGKLTVQLQAVSDTEAPERNRLWLGAAKGKMELTITNNEFEQFFKRGRSYGLQIIELPDEDEAPSDKSEAPAADGVADKGKTK